MTAIVAIDMMFQIVIIAESRVTWGKNEYFQDNLQKIYPCDSHGILGFAGSIFSAKQILINIQKRRKESKHPRSQIGIINDLSTWSREAYANIPNWRKEKKVVEFLYAGVDITKPILLTQNLNQFEHVLFKMRSPDFKPVQQVGSVKIGMAKYLNDEVITNLQEDLFRVASNTNGTKIQAMILSQVLRESLLKIGQNTVSELFQVGTIDLSGVNFISYRQDENNEIKIENGHFVQYDYSNGRIIPVKTIFELNTVTPDMRDLIVRTKK